MMVSKGKKNGPRPRDSMGWWLDRPIVQRVQPREEDLELVLGGGGVVPGRTAPKEPAARRRKKAGPESSPGPALRKVDISPDFSRLLEDNEKVLRRRNACRYEGDGSDPPDVQTEKKSASSRSRRRSDFNDILREIEEDRPEASSGSRTERGSHLVEVHLEHLQPDDTSRPPSSATTGGSSTATLDLFDQLLSQIYNRGDEDNQEHEQARRRKSEFAFKQLSRGNLKMRLGGRQRSIPEDTLQFGFLDNVLLGPEDDGGFYGDAYEEEYEESSSQSLVADLLQCTSVEELKSLRLELEDLFVKMGRVLINELLEKDQLLQHQQDLCDLLTANLQAKSEKRSEDTQVKFSVNPLPGDSGFGEWTTAMKMVARLPDGIPAHFRKTLWLTLAEKHLASRNVNWGQAERALFNESTNPDDYELSAQIVKDLHRTGCSLFCGATGQHNQALLKRVLLAYARWNKSVGYCQGLNMLAALILQVMQGSQSATVKVMIYLIEGVLPESYFANNLRGLSVDMAVFRDLLRIKLPDLSRHLDHLQHDTKESGSSYEPPLMDVFTMQWFLTIFSNCLPQPTVLRVWDLLFLEGNQILLRTALAIWQTLSEKMLAVRSADEFYSIMTVLAREMLEFGLMDANNLIKAIDTLTINEVNELREKYVFNITPWTVATVAKKGLKLLYPDPYDSDEDHFPCPSSGVGVDGSSGGATHQQRMSTPFANHPDREKIALDISLLKKQYSKLRERQRQAHIIFTAACGNDNLNTSSSPALNHLLLGKRALLTLKGRRIQGTVPPPTQRHQAAASPTQPRRQSASQHHRHHHRRHHHQRHHDNNHQRQLANNNGRSGCFGDDNDEGNRSGWGSSSGVDGRWRGGDTLHWKDARGGGAEVATTNRSKLRPPKHRRTKPCLGRDCDVEDPDHRLSEDHPPPSSSSSSSTTSSASSSPSSAISRLPETTSMVGVNESLAAARESSTSGHSRPTSVASIASDSSTSSSSTELCDDSSALPSEEDEDEVTDGAYGDSLADEIRQRSSTNTPQPFESFVENDGSKFTLTSSPTEGGITQKVLTDPDPVTGTNGGRISEESSLPSFRRSPEGGAGRHQRRDSELALMQILQENSEILERIRSGSGGASGFGGSSDEDRFREPDDIREIRKKYDRIISRQASCCDALLQPSSAGASSTSWATPSVLERSHSSGPEGGYVGESAGEESSLHEDLHRSGSLSPTKTSSSSANFNPFPTRTSPRRRNELAVKLGLYSPTSEDAT